MRQADIIRLEFVGGLRLETAIRAVGVKGEGAVADTDILTDCCLRHANAIRQGCCRRCSWHRRRVLSSDTSASNDTNNNTTNNNKKNEY
jgi:hypothetical protein